MKIEELKILLVEDDEDVRSTVRSMLKELGIHKIYESSNGKEAAQYIGPDSREIDLIISDWNMPEKSGFVLLNELRDKKPATPFIMITGRADSSSVQDAVQAGVTGYIRKPFTLKELESKICRIHKDHMEYPARQGAS